MKSFEDIWNHSEKIATDTSNDLSTSQIIDDMINWLNDYKGFDALSEKENVRASLKNSAMGQMLFLLSAISAKDNINVYAALQNAINLIQVKKQS